MNTNQIKGLPCNIYRPARGGSANGGISEFTVEVILIGEDVPKLFEPSDKAHAVRIVRRVINGATYLHAEPVNKPKGMHGPMFGGCFIYTSDSRFPARYPLPLHDRFETAEEYKELSQ